MVYLIVPCLGLTFNADLSWYLQVIEILRVYSRSIRFFLVYTLFGEQ